MNGHGDQHAVRLIIQSKQRLSRYNLLTIYILSRRADDLEIAHLFHGDFFRNWKLGSKRRHLSVSSALAAGLVVEYARFGRYFVCRNVPLLCCGVDKHLTCRCACGAERFPTQEYTHASASELTVEALRVEVGLLNKNIFPVHIQLIGEDHRH